MLTARLSGRAGLARFHCKAEPLPAKPPHTTRAKPCPLQLGLAGPTRICYPF